MSVAYRDLWGTSGFCSRPGTVTLRGGLPVVCGADRALDACAAIANHAPPLDVVENGAWGPEWLLSSFKNPIGLASLSCFAALCFANLCIGLLLGKGELGAERALAGTLLLTGVFYFGWPRPEFNQDVAQMPLWAGVALSLWRATETNRWGWWLLLALFARLASTPKSPAACCWSRLQAGCLQMGGRAARLLVPGRGWRLACSWSLSHHCSVGSSTTASRPALMPSPEGGPIVSRGWALFSLKPWRLCRRSLCHGSRACLVALRYVPIPL